MAQKDDIHELGQWGNANLDQTEGRPNIGDGWSENEPVEEDPTSTDEKQTSTEGVEAVSPPAVWKAAVATIITGFLGVSMIFGGLFLTGLSTTLALGVGGAGFLIAAISRVAFPYFVLKDQKRLRQVSAYNPLRIGYAPVLIFCPPPLELVAFVVYMLNRRRALGRM
jgi:hypothetical protein